MGKWGTSPVLTFYLRLSLSLVSSCVLKRCMKTRESFISEMTHVFITATGSSLMFIPCQQTPAHVIPAQTACLFICLCAFVVVDPTLEKIDLFIGSDT